MIRKLTEALVVVASSVLLVGCPPGTSNFPASNILDLINQKRAAKGCAPVSGNNQLRAAAEKHAVDIRDHPGHFGTPGTNPPLNNIHVGTDGSTDETRIAAAGYSPKSRWGEIIYWASVRRTTPRRQPSIGGCTAMTIGKTSKTVTSRMPASVCSIPVEFNILPSWTSRPTDRQRTALPGKLWPARRSHAGLGPGNGDLPEAPRRVCGEESSKGRGCADIVEEVRCWQRGWRLSMGGRTEAFALHAGLGAGIGISFASLRRFWAAAARWNSSRAPFGLVVAGGRASGCA